jgi:hypothetical protein
MNIAVYDPDSAGRRPWDDFVGGEHTLTNLSRLVLQDESVQLLFVHGSYLVLQDTFEEFRQSSPSIPVVVISGGPPRNWWKDDSRSYWRKAIVEKPGRDFIDCCRSFLRRLDEDGILEFELLEPSGEFEMAFRLLCETKQACGRDSKKEDYNGTGITIHAPMILEDWLVPFGKHPTDADAIDHVAGMIGSSDIETRVKTILDAVCVESQGAEKVLDAIGVFLADSTGAHANS